MIVMMLINVHGEEGNMGVLVSVRRRRLLPLCLFFILSAEVYNGRFGF